ncbi:MAG TPA: trypsin-like peptidase domain-containing protein [Thermoleophilia bacterium]|nr:trypsin-like peptidase domain-containing protein [Thermoleophilia bacterium]
MSVVTEFSQALAGMVEAVAPSVVRVEGGSRSAASGVVWSEKGVVVTTHHAVEREDEVGVSLADGRTLSGRVLGRDPGTDLALLQVEGSGLAPATWHETPPRVGEIVLAIGRPGRAARASLGIVNAVGDAWRTRGSGRIDLYVQLDLGPAPSGSLLVDASGRALGLYSSSLLRHTSMAIPASTLARVVKSIRAHGRVRRGFLGLATYPVPLPPEKAKELGQDSGLMLVSIQPDGPAARGGLLLGDTIVGVDGERVTQPADLLPHLDEERVGQPLSLRVLRAGAFTDLPLTVGDRVERTPAR